MSLPEPVDVVVTEFLRRIDRHLPDIIDSVYLTGSVSPGAFQPGHSDIDFTAVVRRPLSKEEIATLADIHAQLPAQPTMDGQYTNVAQLTREPRAAPWSLHVGDGRLSANGTDPIPVILLHELRSHAITLRGQDVTSLGIGVEESELQLWLRDNLTGYWAPLAQELRAQLADRDANAPANPETVVWAMSGPPRLHYTLKTGEILSKTAALRYALDFERTDHELVSRCLAWRDTGEATFTVADGRRAVVHIQNVIADALAQPTR